MASNTASSPPPSQQITRRLAIGTRFHLGNASAPPLQDKLASTIASFCNFCASIQIKGVTTRAYIAVDATPKFPGYNLVDTIQSIVSSTEQQQQQQVEIIPVTPWNKFTPALNALVSQAALDDCQYCLFVSAETNASNAAVTQLWNEVNRNDTLVAGAVLPGHDYRANSTQPLTGQTSPWNTCAIWNVAKLALTGFVLVAEGLHSPAAAGVEEVSTIAVLQQLCGANQTNKAKLVPCVDVSWNQDFHHDEQRQAWHEAKMRSKLERAQRHLDLLGTAAGKSGTVHHL